jgi:hypothetical protein
VSICSTSTSLVDNLKCAHDAHTHSNTEICDMQDDDDEGGRKLTYEFQQQRVCTGNTNILSGLRGDQGVDCVDFCNLGVFVKSCKVIFPIS